MHYKVQTALAYHQNGLLDQAADLYRDVLRSDPDQVDALHLLGVISSQRGDHVDAVKWFEKAIAIDCTNPHFHFNLGVSLQELGHLGEAADRYGIAGALDIQQAEAFLNQGNCLHQLGDRTAAEGAYRRAIVARPQYAAAHSNLGIVLHEVGQLEAALLSHQCAIEIDGMTPRFHFNLGNILRDLNRFEKALESFDSALVLCPDYVAALLNRGGVLMDLGLYREALTAFENLIEMQPGNANGYSNRGNALVALRRFEEAIQSFEHATQLAPADPQIYLNWGNASILMGETASAIDLFRQAIALDPRYAEAFTNLGAALKAAGKFPEALQEFERAIILEPTLAESHWNKGLTQLLLGDFQTGWHSYEWRWKTREHLRWQKDQLHSDSLNKKVIQEFGGALDLTLEGLKGKTLLVHCEQGLGDTIQFARYLPLLAGYCARLVFEVPAVLSSLLKEIRGVDEFVSSGQPLPPADFQCPLLSLPLAFKTTLESIPSPGPYLQADAAKVVQWSERLGPKRRPRIGLVWSGNSHHQNDHNRSIPLELLVAHLPDLFDWVSLQREVREADQHVLELNPRIRHFGAELKDFSDTAALCAAMDLVISVDTSVAHLSGALGRPTWVLLPNVPDWRWLLDREDSPWYTCAKLYRQPAPGDWSSVLKRLTYDLLQLDPG